MTALLADDRLTDEFIATLLRHRPVDATFVGVHEHDGRLADLSDDGVAAQLADLDDLAARLVEAPTDGASAAQLTDRRIVLAHLAVEPMVWTSDHAPARNPAAVAAHVVFGVIGLLRRPWGPSGVHLDALRSRLAAAPEVLATGEHRARGAPVPWVVRARAVCRAGQRLLEHGLPTHLVEHGIDPAQVRAASHAALEAFRSFDRTLAKEQLRSADRRPLGCGADLLEALLTRVHDLPGGSSQVESLALEELRRAREAAGGTVAGSARATGAPPVPQTLDAYLGAHRATFDAHRRAAEGLVPWPDYGVDFVPTPRWLDGVAGDAMVYPYHAGPPEDAHERVDFLVPMPSAGASSGQVEAFLASHDERVVRLNHVVHHAGLGHHVQNWYAHHRCASRIGRVAATDSAGYILLLSGIGMAEGWASHAPSLMADVGFLTAGEVATMPEDRARAAVRALVDVRLHRGEWSAEQAAAFVEAETGAGRGAAEAVVARLSEAPSTGSAYLFGPVVLERLRAVVQEQRGSSFSVRTYHEELLSHGSVPLSSIVRDMAGLEVADLPAA